jgi:hypothetical protein
MFWMAMAAVIAVAIVCGGAMAVAVVGLAAAAHEVALCVG